MLQAVVYQGLDLPAVHLQLCLKRLAAAAVVAVAAAVVLLLQLTSLLQATSGHSVRNNVSDSTTERPRCVKFQTWIAWRRIRAAALVAHCSEISTGSLILPLSRTHTHTHTAKSFQGKPLGVAFELPQA
jgi:hypothetical protein